MGFVKAKSKASLIVAGLRLGDHAYAQASSIVAIVVLLLDYFCFQALKTLRKVCAREPQGYPFETALMQLLLGISLQARFKKKYDETATQLTEALASGPKKPLDFESTLRDFHCGLEEVHALWIALLHVTWLFSSRASVSQEQLAMDAAWHSHFSA